MSEFSSASTAVKAQFSCLHYFSQFLFLCSFILSHPLYLSYFIFFSPYLLKLISFLSPLFITTFLLLLALVTAFSPEFLQHHHYHSSEPSELEVYKIVFEGFEVKFEGFEVKFEDNYASMEDPVDKFCLVTDIEPNSSEITLPEVSLVIAGEKEGYPFGELVNKVEEQKESSMRMESKEKGNKVISEKVQSSNLGSFGSMRKEKETYPFGEVEHNEKGYKIISEKEESSNLGNFGSMRKEKEWKRTLACKLYEERNGVEGEEGMDSLWERHESDSMKKSKGKSKMGKNGGEDEDEEEEEEAIDGKLCCLQALKFSTGKMNMGMGMGKPNFVKISKALKGIGWLHHHVGKNGKKSFN